MEYVSVMIKNSKTAVNTISDSLGHFKFENVTTGKYKIEFSRVNYKKLSKELTLINDTVLSIKLDPDITFLKEVLVSNKKKL
ncbi:carboxypeptidase-like regulatory domain-containing protein, partial [Acinetobacter baumannii]